MHFDLFFWTKHFSKFQFRSKIVKIQQQHSAMYTNSWLISQAYFWRSRVPPSPFIFMCTFLCPIVRELQNNHQPEPMKWSVFLYINVFATIILKKRFIEDHLMCLLYLFLINDFVVMCYEIRLELEDFEVIYKY